MSSTLDLDGTTITLAAGTTTYYLITDTSVGHNGKIMMSAGAILRFDNKAGAGFAAEASAIEIYINGTDAANCAIISADPAPTNLWSMPASGTLIDASKCEFAGYSGEVSGDYWAFNDCLFSGSRYVTVDELVSATGTIMQRVPLARMCDAATRRVTSQLERVGMTQDYAAYGLREAALNYAAISLLTRLRIDGTKPNSLSLPTGISMSDSIDGAIAGHTKAAAALIQEYIDANVSSGGVSGYERADRVDQDMIALRLNQLTMPTYRGNE